jgi:hypothetical protein
MISHHNEIQDELSDLMSKALFPSAVHDEPKIYPSHPTEQKIDLEHQANPVVHKLSQEPRQRPRRCADSWPMGSRDRLYN